MEPSDAVLAVGVAIRPPRALASQLAHATLLDKSLALAVLPRESAAPLGERLQPKAYRESTVMFIDAVQFSRLAARVDPVTCLKQLDFFFSAFDQITSAFGVEKLRTAGDTYVAVSGIPHRRLSHAVDATFAALRCAQVVASGLTPSVDEWDWSFRIGLHSGPCISGVLGSKKPVYDLVGDTVSVASHVERVGQPDSVCVSGAVRQLIEPFFSLEFIADDGDPQRRRDRGLRVRGLLPELQADGQAVVANAEFTARYEARFASPCPAAAQEALGVELGQGLDEF
ncbi:adenylate/guanylate cyclase domain-containing protein [Nannocystis exedens]|uniref:adenylate/guanylate cyclase domain-containing protein n=1 Tax=Nannocystis exedens TaxID=54 RepID=UPI001180DF27|nr:adenylate/guanylate cyclase domain-containing protein [Nannocystis exedens]